MTSSSNRFGEPDQELTISFKTKNIIPINGKIYVKFPYWNPDAQGTQYQLQSYIQLSSGSNVAQCEGTLNIAFNPTCTFDTSTQTLSLTNGFFGQHIPSGTTLTFKIKHFRNPITTQQVNGFVIQTGDSSSSGIIDQINMSMQMHSVGLITSSNVKINTAIVQEQTQYRVEFFVPIPLSQGCVLEIQFPSQITLEPAYISLVQAFGLPSTQRTLSGTIDRVKNSYTVANACPSYRDNTNSAIIYFTNIQNPKYVMTTSSIEIYIYDQNSLLLSTNGQGPKVTTIQGNINAMNLQSDTSQINQISAMTFKIQPLHKVTADSKIIIHLPQGQLTVQDTCSLTRISLLSQDAICVSNTVDNSIQITHSLQSDYTYSSSQYIEFKIGQIRLPTSTTTTGTFNIQIYTMDAGSYHLVDEIITTNLFQSSNGLLNYGIVTASSLVANQVTSYKFQFAIDNPILQNGYIVIDLPSQLKIPDTTQASCSSFINFENTATCVFTNSKVQINGGFNQNGLSDRSLELSVIVDGILNPRSIQTTSSFTISTYTSDNFMIDTKNDQMTVTMMDTIPMTSAQVLPNILVVGSVNTYTFKLSSPTPLITGDYLLLQFPPELNQPLANTLQSCNGITNLASTLSCSIFGAYGLKVRLQFTTTISANTQFALSVRSVANPKSGDPSSLFQASILDAQSFDVNKNNPSLSTFRVQMAQGVMFTQVKVAHQSAKPFVQTAYTITFKLENQMPPQAKVRIVYPKEITANTAAFACTVSQFGANPQCTIDTSKNLIMINGATQVTLEIGTIYTITIQGLINSKFARETDSFQVETQTPDGHIINYVYQYLTVQGECDWPCFTCASTSQPAQCTSCDVNSEYPLLHNRQCVTSCPKTYYSTNNQCLQCDKSCGECAGGPKLCTKCYNGQYLEGTACVNQCSSDQYIQNSTSYECNRCQEPCATCQTRTNYCTSCLQNNNQRYFYQGFCYASCPLGSYLNEQGTCSQCNSNCLSCLTTASTCTSCRSPLKLNKYDNNCVDVCPVGLTTDTGTTCEYCDPKCKTCEQSNPKNCLSCTPSMSLYEPSKECVSQCPTGTVSIRDKSQSSTCRSCNRGCVNCQINQGYCTRCDDVLGYLFYNFTCLLNQCPSGYARLSKERNICVRDGLVCPYGYDINDYGECELVLQICEPGYVLNRDKTKCIPVPGAYVPLIFLIINLAWTIYVIVKYRKSRSPIQIISQLLVVYTSVQTIMYLIMLGFALALDYMMVKAIHILSYVSMYLANFAFGLLFHNKLRKEDLPFRHWNTEHKLCYKVYKYLMFLFSFKISRGFYCKLFDNKPYFDAAFADRYRNLIRPLFYTTVINFTLQVLPVILMDFYNFIFIPWGYQIMVMGIDNLIMGVVIFILEIIEFTHYKKLAIEEGNLMQPSLTHQYLKKVNDDNVMGAMEDQSMIALNKYLGPSHRDITLGEISNQINIHEKSKKIKIDQGDGPSEKDLLEKLVRRMKEEKKFNKIFDDDSSQEIDDDDFDIEKVGKTKQKLVADLTSKPGEIQETKPRNLAYQRREKLEDKLSFRNAKYQEPQFSALQEQIYRDLQNQIFPSNVLSGLNQTHDQSIVNDQTMDLDDSRVILINQQHQSIAQTNQQQQALESARTEKFYNANDQQEDQLALLKLEDNTNINQSPSSMNKTKQVSFLQDKSLDLFNQDYKSQKNKKERRFSEDLDSSIRQPMHKIDFDDPQKNKEEFAKFKEEFTAKLQRQKQALILPEQERDWQSCDDEIMREWYDDLGPESDFNASEITHMSFPDNPKRLQDAEYLARLELFRELLKSKYQYNNCYTQLTDPHNYANYNQAKTKNVTRRTQTYEKDIAIGYDPFAKDDNYLFLLDEDQVAEIDEEYVGDLIMGVIDQLSEEESQIDMKKDTQPEGSDDSDDFDFEKMKKSKKRKKDIQFDLDDIMGMFDIDDFGNIQLNTETMRDNLNRKVNKNGYLIDNMRNIINQDGDIIFEADELDEDEEIPMPYRFEKRKKQLLKQEEKFIVDQEIQSQKNYDLDQILKVEEDKIEEEFQKLRDISRPSSVDSLIGDLPNKFDKNNLDKLENDDHDKMQSLVPDDNLGDVDHRGRDDSADKRAKDMARAYGGKPPIKKQKKKQSKGNKKKRGDDGLQTQRVFSYLDQEEERLKKMAMISYGISNNNPIKPAFMLNNQQPQNDIQQNNVTNNNVIDEKTPQTKDFEQFFKDQMQEIQQYRQEAKEQYQQQILQQQQQPQQQQFYVPQIPPESIFQGRSDGNINQINQDQQQIEFYRDENDMLLKRVDSEATDRIPQQQQQLFNQDVLSVSDLQETQQQQQNDQMKQIIDDDAQKANRFFDRIQRNKSNNSAMHTYNNYNRAGTSGSVGRGGIQSQVARNNLNNNTQSNMNFNQANPQLNFLNQQPQSVMSMGTIPLNNNTTMNKHNTQQLFTNTPIANNFTNDQNFSEEMQSFTHVMPQQQQQQYHHDKQSSVQLRKFDFYLPIQKNLAKDGIKVKNKLQKNKETKDISFSLIGRMQMQNANNSNNNNNADGNTSRVKGLERVYLQKYPVAPKTMMHEQAHIKKKIGGGQFRSNTMGELNQIQAYRTNQVISSGTGNINRGLNQDLYEYDAQSMGNVPMRQQENFIYENNNNNNDINSNNDDTNWF